MSLSQYELLELAENHAESNGVLRVLITSYNEAKGSANNNLLLVKNGVSLVEYIMFSPDAGVPPSIPTVVLAASNLSSDIHHMNKTLLDICCVLEKLGVKVDY